MKAIYESFDILPVIDKARKTASEEAAQLLETGEPDNEALNDLARLDEVLGQASERIANEAAQASARHQERRRRYRMPTDTGDAAEATA